MVLKETLSKLELIFAVISIFSISCRKIDLVHSGKDHLKEPKDLANDCIHFVHAEWIDEITVDDTTHDNYNSIVLKSYLKNDCSDTIAIGMSGPGVTTSSIDWFWGEEGVSDMIFDKSDRFQIVIPGDSIYLYVTDLRDRYVHKVDSVLVAVDYKVKNKLMQKTIKIDGKDITFRE